MPDSQRVEARAVGSETGAALVFATFRATGQAGAGITAMRAQMSGQPGAALVDSDSVVGVVRDPSGNPVPGATVTWMVAGGGSVSPGRSQTRRDTRTPRGRSPPRPPPRC